ncbi:AraC family transcriptional regulator [Pelagibius litoralis]|uniref:AraC family transcriptional regulator n=1 Tax=Pelagibius litoralis TaxID=374515 RepID=A0A967F238_9PROT|nr:helix-turn-helix transcriptional regulator [Pelagibius litoralis]NIA71632.1 AraC family transcriptional regulator [Pelagibius litoralis]
MATNRQIRPAASWRVRPVDPPPGHSGGHPGDLTDAARPIAPMARDYIGPSRRDWHHHRRGQLLYAVSGVMTVSTAAGTWVVAPEQAVWVPPGVEHQVSHAQTIAMRTLYIDPAVAESLPGDCCVVAVPALLRALILRAIEVGLDYEAEGPGARIMAVILDELRALTPEPLHLPQPRDSRLLKVTRALIDDPADGRPLADWARGAGASERTLARLFVKETGLTFGEWRERLRLVTAVARLAEGEAVTAVALDLGYQSPSAFIAMFRRSLGDTPGRYLRQRGAGE